MFMNCLRNGKRMVLLAIWHPWEEHCCCWLMQYLPRRECPIARSLLETCFSADRHLQDFAPTNIPLHISQKKKSPPYDCSGFCASARTYVSATFEHVLIPLMDLFYNACLKNGQKIWLLGFTKITERRKKNISTCIRSYFMNQPFICFPWQRLELDMCSSISLWACAT